MAQIFASTLGGARLLSIWYRFAIRFEALVIVSVLDAGTLSALSPGERQVLLTELQALTAPGGLHALVPDGQRVTL